MRDAGWARDGAVERARRELTFEIEPGDRLWSAVDPAGRTVGWVWVKSLAGRVAFLEQITVAAAVRRQGHGRAMLAELEELLAGDGIEELRLNVFRANAPARALYAAAGYEETGRDGRRLFLRKRLLP